MVQPKSTNFPRCSNYSASNKNLESRGAYEVESLHVLSQSTLLYVCQISSKSINCQGIRASEEKSDRTKKHKLHEMLDLLCFQSQNLESRGGYEVESLHVLSQSTLLCVCQISSKSINCQGIRASEEKSGPTKKHKLHKMLDLLCFQSQNLESRGAYEVENLHVLKQSNLLCVCQVSSISDNFQGKRASEEKNGQTKKHQFHEMLDLLGFQSQNLESRGGYEVESLHVLSQSTLLCVCQISTKSINCQGIRASDEKSGRTKKHKLHEMLELLCFQSQNLESRGAYEFESLHVLSQSTVVCVCQISSKSINCQGIRASEEKSGPTKKHKLHKMLDLLCFQSQNLESRGAYEVENLHVLKQSNLLCVCQVSSISDNFQGKRASEEKNGQTKKHQFHEMLDLLGFQSQNLESRGGYEVESLHVLSQSTLLCVCQISTKSISCQGIRASEEKIGRTNKHKLHEMLDLLCFQSQNLESRGAYEFESLHVLSQSTVVCVCQISSKSINCQGIRASEEKSGPTKKHKLHEMLDLLCFQ